jgi:hypothetical protein
MDFSKVNKKALISDLVKVATFNIVAHVLMGLRFDEPIFSEKFVYSLIFILIGFTVYHVALDLQVVTLFKEKVKAGITEVQNKIAEKAVARMVVNTTSPTVNK